MIFPDLSSLPGHPGHVIPASHIALHQQLLQLRQWLRKNLRHLPEDLLRKLSIVQLEELRVGCLTSKVGSQNRPGTLGWGMTTFETLKWFMWFLGSGNKPTHGYGSIPIHAIFRGWTSINPSYFDVNYRGIGFWPIPTWTGQLKKQSHKITRGDQSCSAQAKKPARTSCETERPSSPAKNVRGNGSRPWWWCPYPAVWWPAASLDLRPTTKKSSNNTVSLFTSDIFWFKSCKNYANGTAPRGRAVLQMVSRYFDLDRVRGSLITSQSIFQVELHGYSASDLHVFSAQIMNLLNSIPHDQWPNQHMLHKLRTVRRLDRVIDEMRSNLQQITRHSAILISCGPLYIIYI